MKKRMAIYIMAGLSFLASCKSKNSDLQAPAEVFSTITVEAHKTQTVADPKVNILFVVDNSGSMKGYQEKLVQNMRLFSDRFFANERIDYRIGVVPVFDSKYLNDMTVYRSGLRKMNALGELVPLKGLEPADQPGQLFITRQTRNPKAVLEQTVAIGTQWGPEAEESFSPVLAIADEKINNEKNQGFYDPEAYLAVIFLTDADDVTPGLSGEDFYRRLLNLKGGDRSKILIAAALPNLNNQNANCTKDGRGPLQSFPALLAVSGAIFADLCSSHFGLRLADFAQYLVQRVGTQKIVLGFTPDISTLRVTYGARDSKPGERKEIFRNENGYLFDPDQNEVILSSNLKLKWEENAIIFVDAIPANLGNFKNGRLEEVK